MKTNATTHDGTIDLGTRRELFVDDYLIESFDNAVLRLHEPTPREIVLRGDEPWEGNATGIYTTVFEDEGRFRMYYKAWGMEIDPSRDKGEKYKLTNPVCCAYAESSDGIVWHKPRLGICELNGSKANNIVLNEGPAVHNFSPFRDTRPGCPVDERYKAIGGVKREGGLLVYKSADGLRWGLMHEDPVITDGWFDSQNLAFWDDLRGEYRAYFRDFRGGSPAGGGRDIKTARSEDFIHWSAGEWLSYVDSPAEQLYTNQVMPYRRAPHIFVGFPNRYVERPWSKSIEMLPELEDRRRRAAGHERFGAALSDGLFMSSRDGREFKRWGEAFIRPGPQLVGNWAYGDNYQCWGLLETRGTREGTPPELSFYASENYWREPGMLRRYTLRLDGFVSVNAPLSGGEIRTRTIAHAGAGLSLNMSTSAAGEIRVEIQDAEHRPLPGFSLEDCDPVIGDEADRSVTWKGESDLSACAGRPIRLRFSFKDADLYAIQFK